MLSRQAGGTSNDLQAPGTRAQASAAFHQALDLPAISVLDARTPSLSGSRRLRGQHLERKRAGRCVRVDRVEAWATSTCASDGYTTSAASRNRAGAVDSKSNACAPAVLCGSAQHANRRIDRGFTELDNETARRRLQRRRVQMRRPYRKPVLKRLGLLRRITRQTCDFVGQDSGRECV